MAIASKVLLAIALLLSCFWGTASKAGYVICVEPDGTAKIEVAHAAHCDSSQQEKSLEDQDVHDHKENTHGSCGENENPQITDHDSSLRFIELCLVHCSDNPVYIHNAIATLFPEARASSALTLHKKAHIYEKLIRKSIALEPPKGLKITRFDHSQRLNIIKTIVLTV